MNDNTSYWRKCSSCKKPIAFGATYWVCSVSTCNKKQSGSVFCKVACWDTHVPVMNHREAWAEERKAPESGQCATGNAGPTKSDSREEILVVASKVKDYIREQSGLNTSAEVLEVLSDHLRKMANIAIENAKLAERKTILDRDIKALPGRAEKKERVIIRRRPS